MVSEGRFSSIPRLRALVSLDGTVPSSFLQAVEELSRGFIKLGSNVTFLEEQIENLGKIPGLEVLREQLKELLELERRFRNELRDADKRDIAAGGGTRNRDITSANFLIQRGERVDELNEEIRRTREIVRDSIYAERIRTRVTKERRREEERITKEKQRQAQQRENEASDRRFNNLLRQQEVLSRRIADTVANRQVGAYRSLNQQLGYVHGRLRQVARTEQQREQVQNRIFRTQQNINRATEQNRVESQRVGREIRTWRDFSAQFLEHIISAANRMPALRDELVRASIFLGAIGAATFGLTLAFRGAFNRARYTQRAVLRGGLIDRDFTQSLSRAIRLRGSTPEDATEFVAQTPSGFRSDVGDPVERANIQSRIARLGVTQSEFDIGRIANLPDRDLFQEIFRLAQTVYERSGNPASVATLGKILGIDEQEARTLTHLVQARGGIEGLIEDIQEYRPIAEETTLSNLYLGTSFQELGMEAGHISDVFISGLAPALTIVFRAISEGVISVRRWLEENRGVVIVINSLLIGALGVAIVRFGILAATVLQAAFNVTILGAAKTALLGGIPGFIAGLGRLAIGVGAVSAAVAASAQIIAQQNKVLRQEIETLDASTTAINANNNARSEQFNILRLLERRQIFGLTEEERLARFASVIATPSPAPPVPPPGIRSVGENYNLANFNRPIVVNVEGNLDADVLPEMEAAMRRAVVEGGAARYGY